MDFKIGDFVNGKKGAPYEFTNEKMTKGVVTKKCGANVYIKIIEHADETEGLCDIEFPVDPRYLELYEEPAKKEDDEKKKKSDIYKAAIAEVIESNNLPTDKKIDVLAQLFEDLKMALWSENRENNGDGSV